MFGLLKKLFKSTPPVDYKALVQQGAMIIDVRTPEEFAGGHIRNSINIPLQILGDKVADLARKKKVLITVCRSGSRSGMAKNMLTTKGLTCYNGGPWNSLQAKIQ